MAEIVKRAFATYRLDVEGSLHADLQERGVSDPEVLPNYHYRDDALLLHKAIYRLVEQVVEHHYGRPTLSLIKCTKHILENGQYHELLITIDIKLELLFK